MAARRSAVFTEVEIRRAIRAAKAEGFDRVELVQSPQGLRIVCERKGRKTDEDEIVEELEA